MDASNRPLLLVPVEPTAVDIGRVIAAERVVDGLCEGHIETTRGMTLAAEIARRPPVSIFRFAGMAGLGAAALGVIFGAPNLLTLCVIAVVAGTGACLRRGASLLSGNPFLQPFLAALLAGAAGGLVPQLEGPATGGVVAHYLLIVCPCMVLVPGPHFLNGAIELSRAHMPLGLARIAFATLIVLAICAGVLSGLALAGTGFPEGGAAGPIPLAYDVAAAGVAVAAYGSFFNMPWRMLPAPIGIGMLAHGTRWLLIQQGVGLPLGALAACLVVGTLTTPVARRLRMPFGASAFAAVVSLMPGALMFATVARLTELAFPGGRLAPTAAAASNVLADATEATSILLAMTVGIIAPKIFIDAILSGTSGDTGRCTHREPIETRAAPPRIVEDR